MISPSPDPAPTIPIFLGILVGLVASFVQSLGLTIQRKSHLQNDAQPEELKRKPHRRPLWLIGFAVFISSNLFGTIFQIGALPIVILAPLGAVSLLWNALLARILLGDLFSPRTLIGTTLIAGGATLIAVFGVVPEENHDLEELMELFRRPGWVAYITLMSAAICAVLVISHLVELRVKREEKEGGAIRLPTENDVGQDEQDRASLSQQSLDGISPYQDRLKLTSWKGADANGTSRTSKSRSVGEATPGPSTNGFDLRSAEVGPDDAPDKQADCQLQGRTQKARLILGMCFAAASGTLSGMSLLFAKCAVELLILTVGRDNQFKSVQSWILLFGLGATALLQLYYLNHSLTLAGPALICPLAFCFYNTSSIFDGLVFYSQFSRLSTLQTMLVTCGVAVLLVGVWSVSTIEPNSGEGGVELGNWADDSISVEFSDEPEEYTNISTHALVHVTSPECYEDQSGNPGADAAKRHPGQIDTQSANDSSLSPSLRSPFSPTIDRFRGVTHGYQPHRRRSTRFGTLIPDLAPQGLPAGFSIGLNPSSPGFVLRGSHLHDGNPISGGSSRFQTHHTRSSSLGEEDLREGQRDPIDGQSAANSNDRHLLARPKGHKTRCLSMDSGSHLKGAEVREPHLNQNSTLPRRGLGIAGLEDQTCGSRNEVSSDAAVDDQPFDHQLSDRQRRFSQWRWPWTKDEPVGGKIRLPEDSSS